jgi:hypothetical protein
MSRQFIIMTQHQKTVNDLFDSMNECFLNSLYTTTDQRDAFQHFIQNFIFGAFHIDELPCIGTMHDLDSQAVAIARSFVDTYGNRLWPSRDSSLDGHLKEQLQDYVRNLMYDANGSEPSSVLDSC